MHWVMVTVRDRDPNSKVQSAWGEVDDCEDLLVHCDCDGHENKIISCHRPLTKHNSYTLSNLTKITLSE